MNNWYNKKMSLPYYLHNDLFSSSNGETIDVDNKIEETIDVETMKW